MMNLLSSPPVPNNPLPPKFTYYYLNRYKLLFLACLQAFLSSGIFYGWPSLYSMLLDAGIYREKCEEEELDEDLICPKQKYSLELIYTIASSVNLCSQLPWGFVLDWFGPKTCSSAALTMVLAGFIGISCSIANLIPFDLYLLSFCLLSGGGPGIQISLFHLSELFPHHKSTVLAIVTGAFQLGFAVFLGFKLIYNYLTIEFNYPALTVINGLFVAYSLPLIIILTLGLIYWPNQPCEVYDSEDADHLTFTSQAHSHASTVNSTSSTTNALDPLDSTFNPNLKGRSYTKPFLSQFFSPSFLICLLWMCSCLFWANYYIGTVVEQLFIKSNGNKDETREFTNYFTLILPSGVLGIPLFGWLTDHFGFTWSILATSLLGILFSLFDIFPSLSLQVFTFIFYSFFRSFLFSVMFAYLANEFGYRHFGLLSGLMLLLAGLVSMTTITLNIDPNNSNIDNAKEHFDKINNAQLVTCCVSCLFAFYTAFAQRRRKGRLNKGSNNDVEESVLLNGTRQSNYDSLAKQSEHI